MDPFTLAALIALAAGTGTQIYGQRQQNKALVNQTELLRNRRRDASEKANALFEESLVRQDVDTANDQIDAAAEDNVGRVEDLIEAAPLTSRLPGQETASRVVQDTTAGSLSDGLARARARLAAASQLEGFGDRTFNRGVELNRSNTGFTDVAIQNRGADALFQSGSQVAQGAGGNARLLGDFLVGLGTLGLQGGFKKVGSPAPTSSITLDPRLLNANPGFQSFTGP